jgi:sorbitol/mannitol transport system permease protein
MSSTAAAAGTVARAPARRRARRRRKRSLALTLLTWIVTLLMISPVVLLVLTGFKTEADAYHTPASLIFTPTLDHFTHAWNSGYTYYLGNSALIVGVSTLLAIVLGTPAAFSLAFYPSRRAAGTIFWVLSTRFMPAVGVIMPIYVLFINTHLLDTYVGMILLYTAIALPLVILILRAYYLDLDRAIIEAARVDGAGTATLFFRVVLPLSRPGLASAGLLSAIFGWNEFFFALMLTNTKAVTLPVYLSAFQTSEGQFWASMSAAATLAVLPVVLLGWVAQRHLAEGFTLGAVK